MTRGASPEQIGIPYYVVNFERQFEESVVEPFVREYLAGRTPIPCTLCNNFIKFDQFLEMADAVGAHRIATGHYARITYDQTSGRYQLRAAVDSSKDQTYFLFGLTQEQLARGLFPLGEKRKTEVRELARELELAVAEKGESYEICFVPNGDYAAFMDAYLQRERGRGSGDGRRHRDERWPRDRSARRGASLHGGSAEGPRYRRAGAAVRDRYRSRFTAR